MFLGVDLAARYSAAVLLDEGGQARESFDSWDITTAGFCERVAFYAAGERVRAVLIEDLPYGINSQFQVKSPLRLQGYLARTLGASLSKTYFINPSTWQRAMGVWRSTPEDTATAAAALGYQPPDMVERFGHTLLNAKGRLLAVDRKKLRKVETDYVDAFLIGRFGYGQMQNNLLAGSGIQAFTI